MKRFKLQTKQKEEIKANLKTFLASRPEIIFAYLHGSFLETHGFRDIDLAFYLKKIKKEEVIDYEIKISTEIEKKIKYPIDVKVLNYAPLGFRYEILKGELLYCRNDETRFNFIEKTWRDYLDFKPIEKNLLMDLMA
ncbi:MAG: nucleotidyltransferase domain-containing protein [Methanosarcinales archaeon]